MSTMPIMNTIVTIPSTQRSGSLLRNSPIESGVEASASWPIAITGRPALRPEMPAA
jgi:hypothetical protein